MTSKFQPLKIMKQTNAKHSGIVLFLHGSGDNAQGISDWIKILLKSELQFPHLQIHYPTAPLQPYTPLNGTLSNVWFDRMSIRPDVPENKQSIDKIGLEMVDFIKQHVSNDIPLNRIIIGGFSMGGCLSMHLAYRFLPEIAGVFALSSFLNSDSVVYEEMNTIAPDDQRKRIPLFMCHGDRDDLVPIKWGETTFKNLMKLGVPAEFHPLKDTFHELKTSEMKKLNEWILKVLPPLETDIS